MTRPSPTPEKPPMPPNSSDVLRYTPPRNLKLIGQTSPLELSDREDLPLWLQGTGLDRWERGNRWVLEMALTRGADKVTLLHLWDGRADGDAPGGTAHMVSIARQAGMVDLIPIKFDFDQPQSAAP